MNNVPRSQPRAGDPAHRASIRAARPDDLALLVEIERAACETFRSLGMDLVADDNPGSVEELTPYADGGRAFVSIDADDRPVGYLLLDVVDGAAHVEQVSVHPDHARQGLGRALIEQAASWASVHGHRALTLTTYVEVPWNGPYYERLGFRYLAMDEETPGLRAIRNHEQALGLDAWPRACMIRSLGERRLRMLMTGRDWVTVALVFRRDQTTYDARNRSRPAASSRTLRPGGRRGVRRLLRTRGAVEPPARLTIHQGDDLGRPSLLLVDVPAGVETGIQVSGRAIPIQRQ